MKKGRKFSIAFALVLCIALLLPSIAVASSPEKIIEGTNKVSIKAGPEQLKIFNDLKDTKISIGQLIRKVFPKAIPSIADETLKRLDETPMVWPEKRNLDESAKKEKITSDTKDVRLTHSSYAEVQNNNVYYFSDSISYSTVMPYMQVISCLYEWDDEQYVDCMYDSAEDCNYVRAQDTYSGSSGLYQAIGYHTGDYPSGHNPEDYTEETESSWVCLN